VDYYGFAVSEMARTIRERGYSRGWVVDTEYRSFGNFPQARCLCALDILSGERREVWLADADTSPCPFDMAVDELFLFFAADADISIWIAQGWTVPRHVIDVRVEFIRIWNGDRPLTQFTSGNLEIAAEKEGKADKKRRKKPGLYSLARICRYFRIPFISDEEKGDWRDLAMRAGRRFSNAERTGLTGYCHFDTKSTAELGLPIWVVAELSDRKTFNQALIRGFYMTAAAWVRHVGLPINLPVYRRLSSNARRLRAAYIDAQERRPSNECIDVYEDGHFNFERLSRFLARHGLLGTWPRTPSGRLAVSGKVLGAIAEEHTIIADLFQVRATVDLLEGIGSSFNAAGEIEEDEDKAKGLQICPDGRSRAALMCFGTKTSRNAPKGSKFVGTCPAWMWSLVRPEPGRAIAILDYVAPGAAHCCHPKRLPLSEGALHLRRPSHRDGDLVQPGASRCHQGHASRGAIDRQNNGPRHVIRRRAADDRCEHQDRASSRNRAVPAPARALRDLLRMVRPVRLSPIERRADLHPSRLASLASLLEGRGAAGSDLQEFPNSRGRR
jgi:hypothetical protein